MSFTDEKWQMYEDYREQHNLRAVWSIYSVESLQELSGITANELVYSDHWGPKTVRIPLRDGMLTWAELYHAADQAIRASEDNHHIYVEQLTVRTSPYGAYVFLTTGS